MMWFYCLTAACSLDKNVWNIWAVWTCTWSWKEQPLKDASRTSPTPNYAVRNLVVAVVVFRLQLFPLHHSPSCFYFHRAPFLFLSPDPSRLLFKLVIRMLWVAVVHHLSSKFITRGVRESTGIHLFSTRSVWLRVISIIQDILNYFLYFQACLLGADDPQLLLTLINHAFPRLPPFICTLSAALQLIGGYRIPVYIV